MPHRHLVTSDRPWWWDPPGLEPGEWAEWLRTVKEMDPHQRAHRLASSAASRLYTGSRLVEIRCREHDTLLADVRATRHGPLWRSPLSSTLRSPLIHQVDLLHFDGCDAPLSAWCDLDGAARTVRRARSRRRRSRAALRLRDPRHLNLPPVPWG